VKDLGKIGLQPDISRAVWFFLLVVVLFSMVVADAALAVERNRKNLLKIQLRSDKKKHSSRVVMRLNQGGYYETEEDHENRKLIIKLFEFNNFGAQPVKVLDDPLVKGVNVSKKEQYLEIAIYLRIDSYTLKVSLFESPPMCVVDIKATESVAKISSLPKKPVAVVSPGISEPEVEGQSESDPESKSTIKNELPDRVGSEGEPGKTETTPESVSVLPPTVVPVQEKPQPLPLLKSASDSRSEPAEPSLQVDPESKPETPIPEAIAELPAAEAAGSSASEPVAAPKEAQPVVDRAEEAALLLPTESSVSEAESESVATIIEPPPGQELFDQGLKAYQEEDYVAAEEFFSQLVDSFPDTLLNIPAQFRRFDARAQAAIASGGNRDRLAQVIDEFLSAVRLHEDHQEAPWAYLQVARLYEKMEFFYEAAGVYKALLKRYPESSFAAAANFALARLNFSLKRYQNAYDDFSNLLKRQPEGGFSVYAHYYRANALTYLGDARQALDEYRVGLEKDPDFLQRDPLSLYLLGSAYHRLLRYPEAKEYFLTMRNLFPENENTPQALAKIGEILVLEKKLPEAMLMFSTVVKEYPGSEGDIVSRLKMAILGEDPKVRQKLVPINQAYADLLASEVAYSYLIDRHPESPFTDIVRLNLGQLYFRQNQYEKARQVLGHMLTRRLEPGLREVTFTTLRKTIFAEIEELYKKGEYGSIVALQHEYSDDFLSRPGAVYPFLWVGEALHKEGLENGALEVFREVTKLKPTPEQKLIINWGIGDLLLGLERFDEAESFIGALNLKKMPPKWRARMLLLKVRLLQHRGLVREALELLDNVKEEIPEAAIAERVEMAVLEADLLILSDAQGEALEALRRAVTLSFMYPQKVKVDQRLLLGYRLGRMLYEEKNYAAAAAWFAKLTLLAPVTEVAELLYWQLRCQIGLSKGDSIDEFLLRLQKEYPESSWTASAATAVKDFRWQQESRSLK